MIKYKLTFQTAYFVFIYRGNEKEKIERNIDFRRNTMKYTTKANEKSTVKITMNFDAQEWKDAINKAYLKLRNKFAVNGFRKGKAPKHVIESVYGKGVFFEDALNNLFNENYGKVIEKESKKLVDAFNNAFFRPDKGVFVDTETSEHASLHANMLAPFYGFVPEGYEEAIAEFLMKKGMACGVYMSYFFMRGLCRLGKHEYVYDLITSTGENSWYNMIRDGGTACLEAWGKDKKPNTSFCHPWASAPITVLIEDLLGVSYDGTVSKHHIPSKAGKLKMKIPTSKGTVMVSIC